MIFLEEGPETRQDIDPRAQATAQRVMDKLGPPVFVGERALSIGASVGIAGYPVDSKSELDILRHADMALYRAKHAGRGTIRRYEPGLQATAARRLHLEKGLRRAISVPATPSWPICTTCRWISSS